MITDVQIKAMNPEMAAMWIVGSGAGLSKSQHKTLVIACRNGGFVEAGTGTHRGHVERVAAPAVLALIRRGYLEHYYGTEGGVAGQLSKRSREKLTDALKGTASMHSPEPLATDMITQTLEDHERAMFGCTEAAIDEVLKNKSPRDIAMYAMSALSNAQELIHCNEHEGHVAWSVANDRVANVIRQLINVAKHAINKAAPR